MGERDGIERGEEKICGKTGGNSISISTSTYCLLKLIAGQEEADHYKLAPRFLMASMTMYQ